MDHIYIFERKLVSEPPLLDALRAWQAVLPGAGRAPDVPAAAGPAAGPVAGDAARATAGGRARGKSPGTTAGTTDGGAPALLVFSHLRWDFMRHRSRHLMQRLAAMRPGWRVVFIEEPLADRSSWLDVQPCGPAIEVLVPHLVPHLAQPAGGAGPWPLPVLQDLLADWLDRQGLQRPTAWLTTPLAWPLARALAPGRLVYDCGDELGGFLGAPPDLATLEAALLADADLVLAAGPALAAARASAAGSRLRLVANGVDSPLLWRRGQVPGGWAAEELRRLPPLPPGPRLGYVGAIDERVDLALLAALADARPAWQLVLVGPVLKIDPALLPRRPNLHWLGLQPYRLLPGLMAGWQAALLPFVRSAATWHAHPLKVWEALAAGLPVVATALPDLQGWQDAGLVCVGQGAVAAGAPDGATPHPASVLDAWLPACDAVLAEPASARRWRRQRARQRLRRQGWDRAAAACAKALQSLYAAAPAQPAAPVDEPDLACPRDPADRRPAVA